MSQLFPYGIAMTAGREVVIFPQAEVVFTARDGTRTMLFLLLDSGASISVLPRCDADLLGIAITFGEHQIISGFSREPLHAWRHDVRIRIGGDTLDIPVAFLDTDDAPRVLGRAGVFDRYMVVFEQARKRSACVTVDTDACRAMSQTIDGLR